MEGIALITNMDVDGTGAATARALVQAGCRKLMLAFKSDQASELNINTLLGDSSWTGNAEIKTCQYKTTSYEDVEHVVSQTVEAFGGLHYAVNCLAISKEIAAPTADLDPAVYRDGLVSSSREIWLFCQAQSTYLAHSPQTSSSQQHPSIVNIIPFGNLGVPSSDPIRAAAAYSAIGITKSLARDVKGKIRVNAVCPGVTNAEADGDMKAAAIKSDGRLVQYGEVANAVVFMAGAGASATTGVAFPVDLGWCLTHN